MVAIAYAGLSAEQMVEGGQLSDQALHLLVAQNPVNERLGVPVLPQQGTSDDTVPVELTRALEIQRCDLGDDIQLHEYEGETHDGVLNASFADTLSFLNDRLQHREFVSDCG